MKLSDVYGKEKFHIFIDGFSFPILSKKIESGELYLDEEGCLNYKASSSSCSAVIAYDIGEWIYIDDNKILVQYSFTNEPFFQIVDIKGNIVGSGIITPTKSLLYKKNKRIIRESNNIESIVMELPSKKSIVMFDDDSFYMLKCHPCSNFMYHKYFDENGNYLLEKTKTHFMWLLMRDIVYIFIDSKKYFSVMENEDLYKENKIFYDKLHAIESDTQRLTYEIIDEIIDLLRTMGALNKYSYSSYEKIKQLLYKAKIHNDIEIPILNIFSLNMSGKYGRSSARFSSKNITTRLKKLYNTFGPEDFNSFVYDAKKLNKHMDDI